MDFEVTDWNFDGIPDLVGVKKFATGTFRTEVHVARGSRTTGFDRYLLNVPTILPHVSDTTDYELLPDSAARTVQLVGVRKAYTTSRKTDLRIAGTAPDSGVRVYPTAFAEAQ